MNTFFQGIKIFKNKINQGINYFLRLIVFIKVLIIFNSIRLDVKKHLNFEIVYNYV